MSGTVCIFINFDYKSKYLTSGAFCSYIQSQFVGSLPYMAPEVLKNAKYGWTADVYSLFG